MSLRFSVLLSLALLLPAGLVEATPAAPAAPPAGKHVAKGDARYEAALMKVFELTYKRAIIDLSAQEAVDAFLKEMDKSDGPIKTCPAANEAMTQFANHEFKDAVMGYINSGEFRDLILEGMRQHYTQADLDAFIGFAATPAGGSYVEHSLKANAEVEALVKEHMEHMEDSPQIAKMLQQLGAALMVPMMKCKK